MSTVRVEAAAFHSRLWALAVALLGLAGIALGWNKGDLPVRETSQAATIQHPGGDAGPSSLPKDQLAADLALYCEMVYAVRQGANYYDAGREKIPRYGFPIAKRATKR